jgi:hypothetical protein
MGYVAVVIKARTDIRAETIDVSLINIKPLCLENRGQESGVRCQGRTIFIHGDEFFSLGLAWSLLL